MIFGRKETFALEVSPLPGGPREGDRAAAVTWVALRLYVGDRNLFRNITGDTGIVSEALNWPAIGLARWMVRGWTELFHTAPTRDSARVRNAREMALLLTDLIADEDEPSDDLLDARDAFVACHSLRAAAAGGAMPDVWIQGDGDIVSIAWGDSMEGDICFTLSRGERDVPAKDFAEATFGFVGWVHEALLSAGLARSHPDVRLLGDWVEGFGSEEAAAAGLLHQTAMEAGRWPVLARKAGFSADALGAFFALPPAWFKGGAVANPRDSAIAVAFRCTAPVLGDEELIDLRRALLEVQPNAAGFHEIEQLARAVPRPQLHLRDYVQGYRLARAVRSAIGNESEPLDIEALLKELGVPISEHVLSDSNLDGGCVCDADHGPAIFVNPKATRAATAWGRRVVLAHELCHLLFDRRSATSLGVVSGPWAPPRIERTANAFAVELLLPARGIEATVGPIWGNPSDDDIKALMDKYGLGITAVTEHVRNLSDRRNR